MGQSEGSERRGQTLKGWLQRTIRRDLYQPWAVALMGLSIAVQTLTYFLLTRMNGLLTLCFLLLLSGLTVLFGLVAVKPSARNWTVPASESWATIVFYSSLFCWSFASALLEPLSPNYLLALSFIELIALASLTYSFMSLTIRIQRRSKRGTMKFDEKFLRKMESHWNSELPQWVQDEREEILGAVRSAQYVRDLFDMGMFNLAILWCCSTIETVANSLIKIAHSERPTFDRGKALNISNPKKLTALGFPRGRDQDALGEPDDRLKNVFHNIRGKIAHRNEQPTFDETCEAILLLRDFLADFDIGSFFGEEGIEFLQEAVGRLA